MTDRIEDEFKGRPKSSKTVVFLSDMHVGSNVAVCSPQATLGGRQAIMTDFNKDMYENWCEVRDSIEQDIDVLCLNGEPIDGGNVKTAGSDVWTTNIMEQLNDAERLIRMYKWKEIVATRGSRYHVAVQNMFHEEVLARNLGCVPYSGFFGKALDKKTKTKTFEYQGQYTDFFLWFILGGKRFSVCHHVGYNKTELYRTTALGREMAVMEFAKGKWYPEDGNVDVIVRSDVHYHVLVGFPEQKAFTTPCWKLPDEFQLRRGLGGTAVHIGAIEVIVETNGKVEIVEHIVKPKRYPKPYEIDFDKILAKKHIVL